MYQTILVPLDGSDLAERALPIAETVARASGAKILLLRVVPPATPESATRGEYAAEVEEAEKYLASVAARLTKSCGVETRLVEGDPAASIEADVAAHRADLIAMSTHGRSGFGRWIYGSVADEVMRRAVVPVLLVPASSYATWPRDRAPRILVPLDGSGRAEDALGPASELARSLGAEILLVRVVEPHPMTYGDPSAVFIDPTLEIDAARDYLKEKAEQLRAQGFNVKTTDSFGFAVSTILDVVREQGADLIAMSTHGRSGISRFLMGSAATGIVQRSTVPILIVRPSEPAST